MPGTSSDKVHFFISYTGVDKGWAEWIAWQLEQAGQRTLIQAWDFKSGGVFPGDMHRALQQSARVIAVLSPSYMESGFCQPEWQAAFAEDPTGEKGGLVCVRVADFKPDGLLRGRTYIDLVGISEEQAVTRLLERLEQKRAIPATAPGFPGAVVPMTAPTSAQPVFPGAAAPAASAFPILHKFTRLTRSLIRQKEPQPLLRYPIDEQSIKPASDDPEDIALITDYHFRNATDVGPSKEIEWLHNQEISKESSNKTGCIGGCLYSLLFVFLCNALDTWLINPPEKLSDKNNATESIPEGYGEAEETDHLVENTISAPAGIPPPPPGYGAMGQPPPGFGKTPPSPDTADETPHPSFVDPYPQDAGEVAIVPQPRNKPPASLSLPAVMIVAALSFWIFFDYFVSHTQKVSSSITWLSRNRGRAYLMLLKWRLRRPDKKE